MKRMGTIILIGIMLIWAMVCVYQGSKALDSMKGMYDRYDNIELIGD